MLPTGPIRRAAWPSTRGATSSARRQLGGASGLGTVFGVPAGTVSIVTLVSFDSANGANPMGALALDGGAASSARTQPRRGERR